VSERLTALADAADGSCWRCRHGHPARRSSEGIYFHGADVSEWDITSPIRELVERDRPGIGEKPTSEWRTQP
jgi:hypothetical protein